jgi:hypothetical protein
MKATHVAKQSQWAGSAGSQCRGFNKSQPGPRGRSWALDSTHFQASTSGISRRASRPLLCHSAAHEALQKERRESSKRRKSGGLANRRAEPSIRQDTKKRTFCSSHRRDGPGPSSDVKDVGLLQDGDDEVGALAHRLLLYSDQPIEDDGPLASINCTKGRAFGQSQLFLLWIVVPSELGTPALLW